MNFLITTATSTDSSTIALRMAAGIPAASSSEVQLVRDSAVCTQAGRAYAAADRDSVLSGGRQTQSGDSALGRRVQVFKVLDRYVVADETNAAGEFVMVWVFDRAFTTPIKRVGM